MSLDMDKDLIEDIDKLNQNNCVVLLGETDESNVRQLYIFWTMFNIKSAKKEFQKLYIFSLKSKIYSLLI